MNILSTCDWSFISYQVIKLIFCREVLAAQDLQQKIHNKSPFKTDKKHLLGKELQQHQRYFDTDFSIFNKHPNLYINMFISTIHCLPY